MCACDTHRMKLGGSSAVCGLAGPERSWRPSPLKPGPLSLSGPYAARVQVLGNPTVPLQTTAPPPTQSTRRAVLPSAPWGVPMRAARPWWRSAPAATRPRESLTATVTRSARRRRLTLPPAGSVHTTSRFLSGASQTGRSRCRGRCTRTRAGTRSCREAELWRIPFPPATWWPRRGRGRGQLTGRSSRSAVRTSTRHLRYRRQAVVLLSLLTPARSIPCVRPARGTEPGRRRDSRKPVSVTTCGSGGIKATAAAWSTRRVKTGRRAGCGGAACRPARTPPTPGAPSTASNPAPRGPARS